MLRDIIVVGGTVCALFFGSGNIVLPLIVGRDAGGAWPLSYVGFVVGAVLLPILGLLALSLKNGDYREFFKSVGRHLYAVLPVARTDSNRARFDKFGEYFSLFISFVLLAIMGPLGVSPRCLTVAEGGFHAIASVPNYVFMIGMTVALWCIIYKKDQVMPVISRILTPIKLSMIVGVLLICLICSPHEMSSVGRIDHAFSFGLSTGYQTMDLFGAIFFAIVIDFVKGFQYIRGRRDLLSFMIKAGLVGAAVLSALYFGFTLLAARFAPQIAGLKPEDIFVTIADLVLGQYAAVAVGLTIVVSCLTTAVVLMTTWVSFIVSLFEERFKVSYQAVLLVSLVVMFLVSLIGLERILALMAPILRFSYPIILLITIVNLVVDIYSMCCSGRDASDSDEARGIAGE